MTRQRPAFNASLRKDLPSDPSSPGEDLHRGLARRHMSLLALGSCIGVGLFLGSAKAIQLAGPAILIAYALGGLAMLVIMRALGEMTLAHPVAGSFTSHAATYLGPFAGYLTGWQYWFMWVVTCVAEITAVAVYMQVWFPDTPGWMWSLAALAGMGLINFAAVRLFGEFEYWFALIKVVMIIALIGAGGAMICLGLGNGGAPIGLSNLWSHGGFMPNGFGGVLLSLQMVMFAYLGIEMIGLTAGEAQDPRETLPRAFKSVFWRIALFYIGALFVILSLYPWNEVGVNGSPFVRTFERLGVHTAAGIINFVVITAALSSCNGGIFSTGRMLYGLAKEGQAPRFFAKTSATGVPRRAIVVSLSALLLGVILNYLAPEQMFSWATAVATFSAVWTWGVILITHLRYRAGRTAAERASLTFPLRFSPWSNYLALAFLAVVLGVMAVHADTRVALVVGPAFVVLLSILYRARGKRAG
ncbi:amino acid permease [Caulobacter segnis]|uniref:Amino acid permease-associated region n=2 Tax=Caulobacter segnis TaxID=88688 RepID=D5VLZ2_CAUST|nr:amino acid permease [Caulobacter segnis]ADG11515.1 amino acid permease-associated region [Caulobacter segnis ATCC 21756]AVQ03174.1 amino acid permease [Caulobacter segnis]